MERMSMMDASFLYMENEFDLHHNAWLGLFAGPAPTGEEFRRHIASKLPRIPRYRQRVRFVPHDLAAPVWVDDRHFELHRGDSFAFSSTSAHRCANHGTTPAKVLWVITPPHY